MAHVALLARRLRRRWRHGCLSRHGWRSRHSWCGGWRSRHGWRHGHLIGHLMPLVTFCRQHSTLQPTPKPLLQCLRCLQTLADCPVVTSGGASFLRLAFHAFVPCLKAKSACNASVHPDSCQVRNAH
jgi:hypothetical protein